MLDELPLSTAASKVLTINLRIVRRGSAVVPDEWVEAAKYDEDFPRSNHSPVLRNIMIAISLYAFGYLTRDAGPHLPSNVVDSRLAASGQYVTDKLHVNFDNLEYDANGKAITSNVLDTPKHGRFYEAGYVQFGREVFGDYSTKWKDGDEIEDEAVCNFREQGRVPPAREQIKLSTLQHACEQRIPLLRLPSRAGSQRRRAERFRAPTQAGSHPRQASGLMG